MNNQMLRLLAAGFLALAVPCTAFASAVVESLKGNVQVSGAPIRQGERVSPGATLTTGPGAQVLLRFDDGMQVVLDENSLLRLVDFRYARGGPNDRVVFDLLGGASRVVTGEIGNQNPAQFFLRTPQASFGIEGAADFSVALASQAYVSVRRGTVVASNRGGSVTLPAGTTASIASAAVPATTISAAALPSLAASALGNLGAAPVSPSAAPAGPAVSTPQPTAPAGLFVGASAGRSDIDDGITRGLITSGTTNGEDTGFKVFAGYRFHRNLGVELAYVDLGEARYEGTFSSATITGGTLKVTGFNVAALGSLPLGESFAVFAKIGLFIWSAEAKDVNVTAGAPFSAKSDGRNASFGIGASYAITRNFALRAEAERFTIDRDSASLLSAGLVLEF